MRPGVLTRKLVDDLDVISAFEAELHCGAKAVSAARRTSSTVISAFEAELHCGVRAVASSPGNPAASSLGNPSVISAFEAELHCGWFWGDSNFRPAADPTGGMDF